MARTGRALNAMLMSKDLVLRTEEEPLKAFKHEAAATGNWSTGVLLAPCRERLGTVGLERGVWIPGVDVVEVAIVIEKRGWVCRPGPILRAETKRKSKAGDR